MSAIVALWHRDGPAPDRLASIAEIERKLRSPTFALYLGRKASPLGLPPNPLSIRADHLAAAYIAFDLRDGQDLAAAIAKKHFRLRAVLEATRPANSKPSIWLDPKDIDGVVGPHERGRETQRRDGVRDRRTWTFADRQEIEIKLTEAP